MENAESREDRKAMDKENKKLKKEMIKNEEKRIKRLVMLAYDNDFRIKRFKEQQEALKKYQKEKMKQQKKQKY